jgi:hypothetical protein
MSISPASVLSLPATLYTLPFSESEIARSLGFSLKKPVIPQRHSSARNRSRSDFVQGVKDGSLAFAWANCTERLDGSKGQK